MLRWGPLGCSFVRAFVFSLPPASLFPGCTRDGELPRHGEDHFHALYLAQWRFHLVCWLWAQVWLSVGCLTSMAHLQARRRGFLPVEEQCSSSVHFMMKFAASEGDEVA